MLLRPVLRGGNSLRGEAGLKSEGRGKRSEASGLHPVKTGRIHHLACGMPVVGLAGVGIYSYRW